MRAMRASDGGSAASPFAPRDGGLESMSAAASRSRHEQRSTAPELHLLPFPAGSLGGGRSAGHRLQRQLPDLSRRRHHRVLPPARHVLPGRPAARRRRPVRGEEHPGIPRPGAFRRLAGHRHPRGAGWGAAAWFSSWASGATSSCSPSASWSTSMRMRTSDRASPCRTGCARRSGRSSDSRQWNQGLTPSSWESRARSAA